MTESKVRYFKKGDLIILVDTDNFTTLNDGDLGIVVSGTPVRGVPGFGGKNGNFFRIYHITSRRMRLIHDKLFETVSKT